MLRDPRGHTGDVAAKAQCRESKQMVMHVLIEPEMNLELEICRMIFFGRQKPWTVLTSSYSAPSLVQRMTLSVGLLVEEAIARISEN